MKEFTGEQPKDITKELEKEIYRIKEIIDKYYKATEMNRQLQKQKDDITIIIEDLQKQQKDNLDILIVELANEIAETTFLIDNYRKYITYKEKKKEKKELNTYRDT